MALFFFRLRRRGPATEAVIADVLIPGGDERVVGRLCRRALQSSAADYGNRNRLCATSLLDSRPRQRAAADVEGPGPSRPTSSRRLGPEYR